MLWLLRYWNEKQAAKISKSGCKGIIAGANYDVRSADLLKN
jgi:hypothetical protein